MARTSTCRPSSSRPRRIFRPYQDQLHPGRPYQDQLHPGRPRSGALPPRPRCLVPTPRARLGTGAQPCTNRAHRAQPAREHRDTPRPAVAHRAALRASPRPALGSSLLLIFCFARVYSSRGTALLFLLHISHPHVAHPLQGAGRGSDAVAGCRGKRQAAVAAGGHVRCLTSGPVDVTQA